ncbi:MAG: hypothetical protein AVDCRST_MAG91-870 [uncultured Sphingomonadaceae bacterium]|uniref:PilZ domain-containing protein n=1 Tax=uncultured Sphingomonadaceae bacterium TaxID=169976 RepID=A0A6J4SFG1_9SPHN|nr:MAG: hypothetical protein AVDCRST_MAG91-870 [uncultured Sphingomonadaceae bacterium]
MHQQGRTRTETPDTLAANDSERRAADRAPSKDWILTLKVAGEVHPFRLKNISGKGAAGSTTAPVRVGSQVELAFEDGRQVNGVVRWIRADTVGLALAFPLPRRCLGTSPGLSKHVRLVSVRSAAHR